MIQAEIARRQDHVLDSWPKKGRPRRYGGTPVTVPLWEGVDPFRDRSSGLLGREKNKTNRPTLHTLQVISLTVQSAFTSSKKECLSHELCAARINSRARCFKRLGVVDPGDR